jgi:hypothetical protein
MVMLPVTAMATMMLKATVIQCLVVRSREVWLSTMEEQSSSRYWPADLYADLYSVSTTWWRPSEQPDGAVGDRDVREDVSEYEDDPKQGVFY